MPLEFQSKEPPHVLGIPVDVTPSPSEFQDAARGMGMDIFWNHPLCLHAKLTVWGLGVVKVIPKSIPVSGRAQAPAKIFGGPNLVSTMITENLEFFWLYNIGHPTQD